MNFRKAGMVDGSCPTIKSGSQSRSVTVLECDVAAIPFSIEIGLVCGLFDYVADISDASCESGARESRATMAQSDV